MSERPEKKVEKLFTAQNLFTLDKKTFLNMGLPLRLPAWLSSISEFIFKEESNNCTVDSLENKENSLASNQLNSTIRYSNIPTAFQNFTSKGMAWCRYVTINLILFKK